MPVPSLQPDSITGRPDCRSGRYVLRIGAEHFERWLALWRQTAAELFPEHAAAKFVGKAETMAERLLATIDQYHGNLASQRG